MISDLKSYEKYWEGAGSDYVLLFLDSTDDSSPKFGPDLTRCIILNRRTVVMVGIEREDVAQEVKRRMVAAGVPIMHMEEFHRLVREQTKHEGSLEALSKEDRIEK